MAAVSGPRTVTPGLVLNLDAANSAKAAGLTVVEVLVVAGGGGGSSGGGGAGGVIYTPAFAVSAGTAYTVTVGAGGAKAISTRSVRGSNGNASSFSTITATGGGGGGAYGDQGVAVRTGNPGGSGGGGGGLFTAQTDTAGGTGTLGQGNDGGRSQAVVNGIAGGGGGAGSAGVNGADGATGGIGIPYSISGTFTFYGGGGGGGAVFGTFGQGGLGGGGTGGRFSPEVVAINGTVNTGGGGGGANGGSATIDHPSNTNAGAGGSGVVIVRYPGPQRATGGTVATVEGDTVHTFTSVGSSTFTPFASFANGVAFTGVPDLSGLNNVGTAVNGPVYNSDNNGSFVFDGVDDYMTTGTTPTQLLGNPNLTVSGWFKRLSNEVVNTGTWGIGGNISNQGINSWWSNNANEITIDTWGQATFTTGQTYPLDEWVFVVWQKIAGNMTRSNCIIWKNLTSYTGTQLTILRPENTFPNINNNGVTLGRISTTYNVPVNFTISNFKIYNRILSAQEIAENFEAQRGRFGI